MCVNICACERDKRSGEMEVMRGKGKRGVWKQQQP